MKRIFITAEDIEQMKLDFMKALDNVRMADGKFSFTRNFGHRDAGPDEKVTLFYTPEAFLKMEFLVKHYDSEVGWHGRVQRISDKEWLVYDVFVYPQVVTGATVNTDQEKYGDFIRQMSEMCGQDGYDLFFHGHSHVNMSVTPSSVDMTHRDGLLASARPDGFWVFQIWNKKGDVSSVIYDLKNNMLYETADIKLGVLFDDNTTLGAFLGEANGMVEKKSFTVVEGGGGGQKNAWGPPAKNKNAKTGGWPEDADDYPSDLRPYGQYGQYGHYYEDSYVPC